MDDFITTVTAGLEISNRTERMDLNLRGTVAPFFYWDNSDLDEVNQDYRGLVSYRFTPLLDASGDAAFRVDNTTDREVATTGLVFGTNRRYLWHFGAGGGYSLSEITATSLSFAYDRTEWDEDDPDLEDSDGYNLNLGFTRNLGSWMRASTGRLNFGYSDYDYDTSETRSFFGTIGMETRLTEKVSLLADIGGRYVDSEFETLEFVVVPPGIPVTRVVDETNTGWGGIGTAALRYTGLRTNLGLNLSHDLRTQSGASPSVLTRLTGNVDHRLLERLTIGLSAGAFRNKADRGDFSSDEIDQITYDIRPRIRWEFFSNFTLEGAYTYTYVDDNVDDTDRDRHKVYLQLAYGLPLFEWFDSIRATETPAGGFPWPLTR